MKRLLSISFMILLVCACMIVGMDDLAAQCPMCKMSAESNLEAGGTAGKGLNRGILYMFATPYLLVATLGILWYRNRIKQVDEFQEEPSI